ncbi:hypothetical protein BC628DRAFT_1499247 [Trametes gibbosa]|nr:hypothetical protein BC628DRAFT_1499247 [Trametes gibbosa]
MAAVDRSKIAAAAQRNVQLMRKTDPAQVLYTPFDGEYELRQRLRKRIDRDVLAVNALKVALQSLQLVAKLAENILANPSNPAFRRVKMHNERIKRLVVEPKGVLQLLIDIGFREKVEEFVPCYVFKRQSLNELRVGASMIKEAITREAKKQEDKELKKAREEMELTARMEKIHLQFLDDRLSVAARAQRERHAGYQDMSNMPRRKKPLNGSNIATLDDLVLTWRPLSYWGDGVAENIMKDVSQF